MQPITAYSIGETIVFGFLFGFGFAMAQTLWAALVGLVNRRRGPA